MATTTAPPVVARPTAPVPGHSLAALERRGVGAWLTTTDHKKIGILYIVSTFVFFVLGGLAAGASVKNTPPGRYDGFAESYQSEIAAYKLDRLLQMDMVNQFGFLPSHTNGLPDLVIWSHDSADRFPGALWKFNGAEYVFECSWEVVSTFRDVPNGVAEWLESHIENNTCKLKLVPGTETRPNTSSKAE